jgi:PAS domain S-box-containing protein
MAHDEHHEHLIKEVSEIFEPILSDSPQAIYIYLDDTHKICNQNFSDLLGYDSIEDWVKTESPIEDVVSSDQNSVIEAYGKASENLEASFLSANVKTKGGSEIEVEIIMTPFTYKGEVFVIHYITPKLS